VLIVFVFWDLDLNSLIDLFRHLSTLLESSTTCDLRSVELRNFHEGRGAIGKHNVKEHTYQHPCMESVRC
jgi:hypothetical protein